jgi:hypothetical protein
VAQMEVENPTPIPAQRINSGELQGVWKVRVGEVLPAVKKSCSFPNVIAIVLCAHLMFSGS